MEFGRATDRSALFSLRPYNGASDDDDGVGVVLLCGKGGRATIPLVLRSCAAVGTSSHRKAVNGRSTIAVEDMGSTGGDAGKRPEGVLPLLWLAVPLWLRK